MKSLEKTNTNIVHDRVLDRYNEAVKQLFGYTELKREFIPDIMLPNTIADVPQRLKTTILGLLDAASSLVKDKARTKAESLETATVAELATKNLGSPYDYVDDEASIGRAIEYVQGNRESRDSYERVVGQIVGSVISQGDSDYDRIETEYKNAVTEAEKSLGKKQFDAQAERVNHIREVAKAVESFVPEKKE